MVTTETKVRAYRVTGAGVREYRLHPLDPDRGFKGGFVIDEHDAKLGGRVGRVHLETQVAETLALIFRDIHDGLTA